MKYHAALLRGIKILKNILPLDGGVIEVGVIRRSFPPHPNPLPDLPHQGGGDLWFLSDEPVM